MAPIDPFERVFRDQPFFSALTTGQQLRIRRGAQILKLKENQSLFEINQNADRFFVLYRGHVKLFRLSSAGLEKIIEIVRPGDSFATAVMFMEQKTYPVCATTLKPSQIIAFENKAFLTVLRESPETCFRIMADLSQRLRQQVERIDQLSQRSAPTRLATYLVEKQPETGSGKVLLDAPKHVIASRLSIQPETFSRALSVMSQRGIIKVSGKTIDILDLATLRHIAKGNKDACIKCRLS